MVSEYEQDLAGFLDTIIVLFVLTAISNRFDFEDFAVLGNLVKGSINRLQQDKDLRGFALTTPSGKSGNVHE